MPAINITDLNNSKIDIDHIADIAISQALTATDRLGHVKDTMTGAISKVAGFVNRGTWVTATLYAVKDLVLVSGTWYVAVMAHTSSATFATDSATKWRVFQGTYSEEVTSVKQLYSAVGNGVADDTAAIASANAAGERSLPAGDYMVTSITNPMGNELTGPGRILKTITGGQQQLNSYADKHKYAFGQEYLAAYHKLIISGAHQAVVVFSGDSTTAGDSTSGVAYQLHSLFEKTARSKGLQSPKGMVSYNHGHSGQGTAMWLSTYLAADIATGPDLYVIRWGVNDPGLGAAAYLANLRSGLATLRAWHDVSSLSIILMMPNSTSDTPNGRDEKWYESIAPGIKQAARDYQCTFIDTYAYLRDSRPAAGVWMDNPYSDGRAIHPYDVMNLWIVSLMASIALPDTLKAQVGLINLFASQGIEDIGDASRLPNYYGVGITVSRAYTGFPFDGSIITTRSPDDTVTQYNYPYQTAVASRHAFRIGRSANLGADAAGPAWEPWVYFGTDQRPVTPGTGFTQSTGIEKAYTTRSGGLTEISGYLNGPGTVLTAGQNVGAPHADHAPPSTQYFGDLIVYSGSSFEKVRGDFSAGAIVAVTGSTIPALRVYFKSVWRNTTP